MSAQALAISNQDQLHLRSFDARRDLLPVADLVELCFADSLDADGRLYIRQMRQAARNPMLDWNRGYDLPMGGMVWEEDGQVVGNLNLIPHDFQGQRMYLIANVVVRPELRRRGIGRALTQAALEEVAQRGRHPVWLQVDETNPPAVNLYLGMGFVERMRRTSWRLHPKGIGRRPSELQILVRPRKKTDWDKQRAWLDATYPQEVRWHLPIEPGLLQPGIFGSLQRTLSDRQVEQWSAESKGKLLGVLSWQSSSLEADRLWLAAAAGNEDEAIKALTETAHANLVPDRKLALNYPSDRAKDALSEAGFYEARTLIWMQYPWR